MTPAGGRHLAHARWPELDPPSLLLAVPLGATEQHGPHLPLGTDTLIASAVADRLAAGRADVVVAPALPFGSSGEHAGFPGTLSIGQEATEAVLVELVRSAMPPPPDPTRFRGVVLVNGHGGNAAPVRRAVDRLTAEGRDVLAWWPRVPGGDPHAGRTETSLLGVLAPHLVDAAAAVAGPVPPLARLAAEGVRALSPSGVLGDPTGAGADEGERLLALLGAQVVDAVAERWPAVRPG